MQDLTDRHPSTQQIARYFEYGHLSEPLRTVSARSHNLAERMITWIRARTAAVRYISAAAYVGT